MNYLSLSPVILLKGNLHPQNQLLPPKKDNRNLALFDSQISIIFLRDRDVDIDSNLLAWPN